MCIFNSFYQNFLLKPYYTAHGPDHQPGFQSQIRHLQYCLLASISPELTLVFLISLTIISQLQSKGPLLFNVTGNNSFFSVPDTC